MRTTAYFREVVLPKRPYVTLDLCRRILAAPLARQVQPDGRVRYWGRMLDEPAQFLRVVTSPTEKRSTTPFATAASACRATATRSAL